MQKLKSLCFILFIFQNFLLQSIFAKEININGPWHRFRVLETLTQYGVVPTISASSVEDYLSITEAIVNAGLPVVEMCFREGPDGIPQTTVDAIREARKRFGDKALIGCGTVHTAERTQSAIDAGAQFVVSNIFDERIIHLCNANCIPVIPGVETNTEVRTAMEAGCLIVKVLPGGPTTQEMLHRFNVLRTLFPRMTFQATGGISPENIGDFLKAGSPFCASGLMVKPEWVQNKEWQKITEETKKFLEAIRQTREGEKQMREPVVVREEDVKTVLAAPPSAGKRTIVWQDNLSDKAPFNVIEVCDDSGQSEIHENKNDLFLLLEGKITFVVGGKLTNQRETEDGELRGDTIEGGEEIVLKPGDWLEIPAGVPHQSIHSAIKHGSSAARLIIVKIPVSK